MNAHEKTVRGKSVTAVHKALVKYGEPVYSLRLRAHQKSGKMADITDMIPRDFDPGLQPWAKDWIKRWGQPAGNYFVIAYQDCSLISKEGEYNFVFRPENLRTCIACGFPYYAYWDCCPICHGKEKLVGNFKCPKHPEYSFWAHVKVCPICIGEANPKPAGPRPKEDRAKYNMGSLPSGLFADPPKRARTPRQKTLSDHITDQAQMANTTKSSTPRKQTKTALLREAFAEKPKWDQDSLLEKTGYDARNLNTALAILRNPKRTKDKDILHVKYDRKTRTYELQ